MKSLLKGKGSWFYGACDTDSAERHYGNTAHYQGFHKKRPAIHLVRQVHPEEQGLRRSEVRVKAKAGDRV